MYRGQHFKWHQCQKKNSLWRVSFWECFGVIEVHVCDGVGTEPGLACQLFMSAKKTNCVRSRSKRRLWLRCCLNRTARLFNLTLSWVKYPFYHKQILRITFKRRKYFGFIVAFMFSSEMLLFFPSKKSLTIKDSGECNHKNSKLQTTG